MPLIGALLMIAIVFLWRPWLQHHRHGSWGIVLFRSGGRAQKARDSMAVVLFALLVGQAVVAAAWPEVLPLSEADRRAAPGVILAGYALLLPTLLSAAMLAGAYLALRQQIAAEESYLLRAYGEEYRNYARRVGRLLPGIGKLRDDWE